MKVLLGPVLLGFSLTLAPAALPAEDAPASLQGTWKLLVNGERDYIVEVRSSGEKVSGFFVSPRSGRYPFEGGTYSGGKLRVEVPRKFEDATRVYLLELSWKENRFEGTLAIDGNPAGNVTLTSDARPASLAGKWKVVAKTSDGAEHASVMVLEEVEGKLRGKASSDLGEFELKEVAAVDSGLTFTIVLPIQGNDVAFVVNAKLEDPRKLSGRWKARDAEVSGEWSAEREAPPAPPAPAPGAVRALAGDWYGVSTHPDGQKLAFRIELKPQGEGLSGVLHDPQGNPHDMRDLKVQGDKVEFSILLDDGGSIRVVGEVKDGALGGSWSTSGGDSGQWTSRRPTKL